MRTLFFLVLPIVSLTGCGDGGLGVDCNLMYAPSFLEIRFDAEVWDAGDYEVTVVTDETITCAFTLPADDDWTGSCDDPATSVFTDADGVGLDSITLFDVSPEFVELSVTVDGAELLSGSLEPEYVEDEPNGPDCGVRRSGSVTLAF